MNNGKRIIKALDRAVKIYLGKDHTCRCGCSGMYWEKGETGFEDRVSEIRDLVREEGYGEIETGIGHMNIPIDGSDDECYCLYFG